VATEENHQRRGYPRSLSDYPENVVHSIVGKLWYSRSRGMVADLMTLKVLMDLMVLTDLMDLMICLDLLRRLV